MLTKEKKMNEVQTSCRGIRVPFGANIMSGEGVAMRVVTRRARMT
jgi:hypothetical protein